MIDNTTLSFLTAFSIGFLGSLHCVGMCGGISSALATATPPPTVHLSPLRTITRKLSFQFFYSTGRLLSYMTAGAIVGGIGTSISLLTGGHGVSILRLLAGVMMILLGFYISGWWMGLSKLERAGSTLWKRIRPLTTPLMPVDNLLKAGALGALWGWLPCGLVYSGLAWTMTAGNPIDSALLMLFFGIGTLPAMIGVGFFGGLLSDIARSKKTRSFAGIIMIIYGGWTLWGNLRMMTHDQHQQHHDSPITQDEEIDHSKMLHH
ncbi:hypothetical protein A9Q99_20790 [Gammaproteobacteria bacterium 45_16_T64]|nr:hypothetical protein A9Q99_20790 [Gammaproteobacteria bacterium 45_16_T64]